MVTDNTTFTAEAIDYAKTRWFLDDPLVIEEWCKMREGDFATPAESIDAFAEKYGLDDPKELGLLKN